MSGKATPTSSMPHATSSKCLILTSKVVYPPLSFVVIGIIFVVGASCFAVSANISRSVFCRSSLSGCSRRSFFVHISVLCCGVSFSLNVKNVVETLKTTNV